MSRLINFVFVFVVSFFLTACGGGGGGGGATTVDPEIQASTIDGVVIDNYIYDAIVCIDTNKDNDCNDESASNKSVTDENGEFRLTTTTPLTDDTVIIAYEGKDASTTEDFNYILKNVVTNKDSNNAVVLSSINTLVADYKSLSGSTLNDAKTKIANFLDLNSSKMIGDVISTRNTTTETEFLRSLKIFQMVGYLNDFNTSIRSAISFKSIAQAIKDDTSNSLKHDSNSIPVSWNGAEKNIGGFISAPVLFSQPVQLTVDVNQTSSPILTLDYFKNPDGEDIVYTLEGTNAMYFSIGDGNILYLDNVPPATQQYELTVKATTGTGLTAKSATVQLVIPVKGDNETAPYGTFGEFSTNEDTAYSNQLTGFDLESYSLTYYTITEPSHGVLYIAPDGSFTYTPAEDYNGTDSFVYAIWDGAFSSAGKTVSIVVNPINDAPVATTSDLNTSEDVPFDVLINGTDAEGDSLIFSIVSQPGSGSFTTNPNGTFRYTPREDRNNITIGGKDSFTYKAFDGSLYSEEKIVHINIEPQNDAPITSISNISFPTNEDTLLSESLPSSDVDGDTLRFYLVQPSLHGGSIAIDENSGLFTYTPSPNYNSTDSFSYKVYDGTVYSLTKTVSLLVNPVNDAPVFTSGATATTSVNENQLSAITLLASDPDGDSLTYSISGTDEGNFTVNPSTGVVTFKVAPNYDDPDNNLQFTFMATVTDSHNESTTQEVTINIINDINEAGNDAPVDIILTNTTIDENNLANATIGTLSSVDGDSNTYTYSLVSGDGTNDADNDSFTILANSNILKIIPSSDFETKESYFIRIQTKDDTNLTFQKDFVIDVNNTNEKPEISTTSFANQTQSETFVTESLDVTDPDTSDTTHIFSIVTKPNFATLTIDSSTGALSGLAGDAFVGINTIQVRVTDAGGLYSDKNITLTIDDVNDKPTSLVDMIDANITVQAGVPYVLTIEGITDGDSHMTQTVTLEDVNNSNPDVISIAETDISGTDGTAKLTFGFVKTGTSVVSFKLRDNGSPVEEKLFTLNIEARGSGYDLYKEQKDSNYTINTITYDEVIYDWDTSNKWYASSDTVLLPIKNITNSAYLGADLNVSSSGHYSMMKNKMINEGTVYPSSTTNNAYINTKQFLTADGTIGTNATKIVAKDNKFAHDARNNFFVSKVLIDSSNLKSYNDHINNNYCATNYGTGWRLPTAVEIGNTARTERKYGEYIAAYVGDTTNIILTSSAYASDSTYILGMKQSDAGWYKKAKTSQEYFRCIYQP